MINKDDWEIKKLGEICIIHDNLRKPISKNNRIFGDYPYYGASGIQDYVDGFIFDGCYVLVGEDGAKWGENEKTSFIAKGKFWANNHVHVLEVKEQSIHEWIVYYLNYKNLDEHISGAVIRKLNQSSLRNIPIPIPPLPIQQQIVSELDTLNEIITKKKQQLAELDNLAQATFYDMFGDPVTNEKGLPLRKLCKISSLKSGQFVKASDIYNQFSDGLYPCYGGNGLRGYTKSHTHSGELVLIGRQGALCGNVKIAKNMFHATEHAVVCTPIVKYEANWLYYMLEKINFHRYATGAAQPGLAVGVIEKIDIPIPPLELQTQFSDKINAIEKQKELIKKSINDTQLLFDYTMDKYFN